MAALDVLSFERSEQDTIFKILSSVLHIGNIYFKKIHVSIYDLLLSTGIYKYNNAVIKLPDITFMISSNSIGKQSFKVKKIPTH